MLIYSQLGFLLLFAIERDSSNFDLSLLAKQQDFVVELKKSF